MDSFKNKSTAWNSARRKQLAATDAAAILTDKLPRSEFLSVIHLLHSSDSAVRASAVKTLAAIGGNEAAVAIAPLVNDHTAEVRVAACEGLGHLRARAAQARLLDSLHDRDARVVCAAAHALAQIGDHAGREQLAALIARRGPSQYHALRTFNCITGQDFRINAEGVRAALRWLRARKRLRIA